MKRFFVFLVLALMLASFVRSNQPNPAPRDPAMPRLPQLPPHLRPRAARSEFAEARRQTREALAEARRALEEARHQAREAYREARAEVHQAWHEVSDEVRQTYHEALAPGAAPTPLPPPPPPPREHVEGLPVPIVAGTRVTEAQAQPPASVPAPLNRENGPDGRPIGRAQPPAPAPAPLNALLTTQSRTIEGLISATEDRARADAGHVLNRLVAEWLGPDVPASWVPPALMVQAMVLETRTRPVVRPYGTLYVAELKANFSPEHRATLIDTYNRQLVEHRLATLGGMLAFVLVLLAAISGYIRADEATKGYYTNRLRVLTAAGVGAAGVILYNIVA